ncbi:MAG: hypothetical protein K6T73_02980 [Candidatus Bathyarchaeota archaeon]|nr:hypothetical protein [Candidatus Bathyarchaeota archaeon]
MLKPNYIGIIAGILAFISIALPWWTYSAIADSSDLYLYQVGTIAGGTIETWFVWTALALIIIGGIIAIVGSVMAKGKTILLGGGVLALLSIIIFAVGLQMELPKIPVSGIGLFSGGSDWSTYLSYGFWIALVAAIIAFVAFVKHPTEVAAAPPS